MYLLIKLFRENNVIIILLITVLCSHEVQSQAPVNDDKANATLLTLDTQGNFESVINAYTLSGATPDEAQPANWQYGLDGNVWFKFTANQPLLNLVITGSVRDKMVALYDDQGNTIKSKTGPYQGNLGMLQPMVVGEEYYLNIDGRISYTFGLTISSALTFDYKNGAELLVLDSNGELETAVNTYTLVGSTPDGDEPANWSYGLDGNVWFKFTASHSFFNLVITGSINNKMAALYDSQGNILESKTGPYLGNLGIAEPVTIGEEYYLNIDGRFSATFGLKITSELGFDYKDGAELLSLGPNGDLETATNAYTLIGSTPDEAQPASWYYGLDGNVWFKFTANQPLLNLVMTGAIKNKMAALYDSQGNVIESKTGPYDGNLGILQPVTIGEEYFLNIDGRFSSSFGLKISSIAGFDYKSDPEVLVLDPNGSIETATNAYTLVGSTPDGDKPANWSYDLDGNVWFEFEASQAETLVTITGIVYNKMLALYDDQGSLMDSNTGPYTGDLPMLFSNLTPSQHYFLNVDGRFPSSFGIKIESFNPCKAELWAIASGAWDNPATWSEIEGGVAGSATPCENTVVYIKGFDISYNSLGIETIDRLEIIGVNLSSLTRLHIQSGGLYIKEQANASGLGFKLQVEPNAQIKVVGTGQ